MDHQADFVVLLYDLEAALLPLGDASLHAAHPHGAVHFQRGHGGASPQPAPPRNLRERERVQRGVRPPPHGDAAFPGGALEASGAGRRVRGGGERRAARGGSAGRGGPSGGRGRHHPAPLRWKGGAPGTCGPRRGAAADGGNRLPARRTARRRARPADVSAAAPLRPSRHDAHAPTLRSGALVPSSPAAAQAPLESGPLPAAVCAHAHLVLLEAAFPSRRPARRCLYGGGLLSAARSHRHHAQPGHSRGEPAAPGV